MNKVIWKRRASDRVFYIVICLISWGASLGGFFPGFIAFAQRRVPFPPIIVHVHATLFMGWLFILTAQIYLVEKRGRYLAWHRRLGWFTAGWAAAMVLITLWMCPVNAIHRLALGQRAALFEFPLNLVDMLVFAGLISSAILLRRDAEAHKRLIVLASIFLLDGGCARLFNPFVDPYFSPGAAGVFERNFLWVDGIVLCCVLYDVITRGRPHPVQVRAIPLVIICQIAASVVSASAVWQAAALNWAGVGSP